MTAPHRILVCPKSVQKPVLGDREWAGAEWWSQVYNDPGKGLAFHFDKDEHLMARKHTTPAPLPPPSR